MLLEQFMNESFDPFNSGYNYDVEPTNEGYDFNNGGFEIALQECDTESSKLNMADIVAEYQSCRLISEGSYGEAAMLQENVLKTFFEKLKEIVKAMWRKMKEIMQTVVLYFTKLTSDTKFITQMKKALNTYRDFSNLEVEGYKFTLDAIDPLASYNNMNKKLHSLFSEVKKQSGLNLSESVLSEYGEPGPWDAPEIVFSNGSSGNKGGGSSSESKSNFGNPNRTDIPTSNSEEGKKRMGMGSGPSPKLIHDNESPKVTEEEKLKLADLNQKLEEITNDDAIDKIISAGFNGCSGKAEFNDYLFKALRSGTDSKESVDFSKSDCIKAIEGYKKALASVKNIQNQVDAVHKKALAAIDKAKTEASKQEAKTDNAKVLKTFAENVCKKLAAMTKDNLTYTNTAIAAKNAAIKEERTQAKSMLMKAYNQAKKNQKETLKSESTYYGDDVLGQLMSRF